MGGGGFSFFPHPCPSLLGSPSHTVVTLGVLFPWGNSATRGVLVPCGESTSPPTPWRDPHGLSATPESLQPNSFSPTPGDLWATPESSHPPSSPCTLEDLQAGFSRQTADLPLFASLAPWRPLFLPCWRPRRRLSWCRPCRTLHHPNARPHRLITSPVPLPSTVCRSTPIPLR